MNDERIDEHLAAIDAAQTDPQPTPLEAWLMKRPLTNCTTIAAWLREWHLYYVTHDNPVTHGEFMRALAVERWRREAEAFRLENEKTLALMKEMGW